MSEEEGNHGKGAAMVAQKVTLVEATQRAKRAKSNKLDALHGTQKNLLATKTLKKQGKTINKT